MRKALYIGGGIILLIVLVVIVFRPSEPGPEQRPISELLADVRAGSVSTITITGNELTVDLRSGFTYASYKEQGSSLLTILADNGIESTDVVIEVKEPSEFSDWLGLLIGLIPILVFGALIYALVKAINRVPRQQ